MFIVAKSRLSGDRPVETWVAGYEGCVDMTIDGSFNAASCAHARPKVA